ncbi:MAG: hypothetical protein JJ913_17240 [Rhizobiaceae bacterium]|nr:hypothetical protein [Rhizobiaceae bacterium]
MLGPTTAARADCQCVAGGKRFVVGEVACISLPSGDQLARCSMVLNNSSWTKLQDSCPVGFDDTQQSQIVASVDHHAPHDGHAHHKHGTKIAIVD